jgi:WD40 repeat protein
MRNDDGDRSDGTPWILIIVGSAVLIVSCIGVSGVAGFFVLRWRSAAPASPRPTAAPAVAVVDVPPPNPPAPPAAVNPPNKPKTAADEPLPKIVFRTDAPVPLYDPRPPTPEVILAHELRGHRGAVFAGAFLPDGRTAITGGQDAILRFWNVAQGKEELFLPGHKGAIRDIAVSADGKQAASASEDGTIRLWDLEQRAPGAVITANQGKVYCAAFSPDGSRVYSGGDDRSLRVWSTTTGRQLSEYFSHEGAVISVTISRDGKRAVTGGADNCATHWDLEKGEEICFVSTRHPVRDIALLADGNRCLFATAKVDFLWDMRDAQRWTGPSGPGDAFVTAAILPGDRFVLTGYEDGLLEGILIPVRPHMFTETGERPVFSMKIHEGAVRRIRLSPNAQTALTCGADGLAKLWHVKQPITEIKVYRGHTSHVRRLAMAPDGKHFASCGWDNKTLVWDIQTAKVIATLVGPGHKNVNAAAFSDDNHLVTVGGHDHAVRYWDILKARELWHREDHPDHIDYVAVSRDGKQALTSSKDKTIRTWDLATGNPGRTLGHTTAITSATYTPDGKSILSASGGSGGSLILWNAQTGKEIRRIEGGADEAIISADGRTIVATGAKNTTACLWEFSTGKKIQTFEGHSGAVVGVDISPDGKRVATASSDHTARVWDAETGKELHRFAGHTGLVWSVRFTLDGKNLLSCGEDQTIRLWPIPQP